MNEHHNRRAMDRISPQIFSTSLKKDYLNTGVDSSRPPAIHCYESAPLTPEFIQDVLRSTVALANTHGGVILFNAQFDAQEHKWDWCHISRERLQSLQDMLNRKIAADIEPPLDVQIWMIEFKNQKGQYVLVLRVPASRACPHMVTGNDENAIYIYQSDGPMRAGLHDIEQLFQRKITRKINMSVAGDKTTVELTEEELKVLLS